MVKHYKNEGIMKFLTIIGALIGLVYIVSGFAALAGSPFVPTFMPVFVAINTVVYLIVGLIVVIMTFLAAMRPGDPIPFHWLVLFILGILLLVFGGGLLAGILVILAGLIGLVEEL
jgi:ABC-type polysaccharide/polyol phosphate export permease